MGTHERARHSSSIRPRLLGDPGKYAPCLPLRGIAALSMTLPPAVRVSCEDPSSCHDVRLRTKLQIWKWTRKL
uniref:Uncharacterized protein n=1 Tax=Hyaloperonospora arabidopsidis (strain Emoy2) TaxID=559515 RepID=M4C5M0_HYAAE